MPLAINEIKKLIKESIPDASIEIKDLAGDNNHYSATIKSKMFKNLNVAPESLLIDGNYLEMNHFSNFHFSTKNLTTSPTTSTGDGAQTIVALLPFDSSNQSFIIF